MMMGTRIEVSGIQQAIMTGKTERPLQLSQLRAWLSDTPYDCKCVRKVDGGYINLTVRGDLRKPLEDGNQSVVVKQSFEFAVVAPDSPCSLTRSVCAFFFFYASLSFIMEGLRLTWLVYLHLSLPRRRS